MRGKKIEPTTFSRAREGTLPLTWEKVEYIFYLARQNRNTPTYVGKRLSIYAAFRGFRCHLYEKLLQNLSYHKSYQIWYFLRFFVQEKRDTL